MSNTYTIYIDNESGTDHTYAIFNDTPIVEGSSSKIWSNVFATAQVANGEKGSFEIFEGWAAQITTSQGSPGVGVVVQVGETDPVTLNYVDASGKDVLGTTVELTSTNGTFPKFVVPDPPPAAPKPGQFEFITDNSFTQDQANEGKINKITHAFLTANMSWE